jgi:hypothetical protein
MACFREDDPSFSDFVEDVEAAAAFNTEIFALADGLVTSTHSSPRLRFKTIIGDGRIYPETLSDIREPYGGQMEGNEEEEVAQSGGSGSREDQPSGPSCSREFARSPT